MLAMTWPHYRLNPSAPGQGTGVPESYASQSLGNARSIFFQFYVVGNKYMCA